MKTLLVIDVGNTHTVLGLYRGEDLRHTWRITSLHGRTSDELWLMVDHCIRSAELQTSDLDGVGISSVVPILSRRYAELATQRLGIEPVVVSPDSVPSLKIDYRPPRAVGADRICNAVAGFRKYGGPLIVIDLGTATVFDVIGEDGGYQGGLIAPGLETAAESLHRMTAALPRVDLTFPESVVGKTTVESIQAGILYGAIEMIDGMVRRIQSTLPRPATVIATGGFSLLLKEKSTTIRHIEPHLVLEGIKLILEEHSS